MADRILVTYASCTGSTMGVAQAIGKTLAAGGLPVDVLPVCQVHSLLPYHAIVAGSAIHNQQWLPEALEFVEAHRPELSRKPFAAFLVCMTLGMRNGQSYRPFVSEFLAPVRRLTSPLSEGLFAGALDIRQVPTARDRLAFRLSVLCGVWRRGDHRDWNAIRAWASTLPPLLA